MTSHGNRLYVSRHDTEYVDVYDADSLSAADRIFVPGVGPWPMGLAVDDVSATCLLYVSSYDNGFVVRVPLDHRRRRVRTYLPVSGRGPVGLSASPRTHVVLVACVEDGGVEEYDSQVCFPRCT